MKKFMLCIMGSLIALFVVFWCCISYTVNYMNILVRQSRPSGVA